MAPETSILFPYILLAGGGLIILCSGISGRRNPTLCFAVGITAVVLAGFASAFSDSGEPSFRAMIDGSGFARYFVSVLCAIAAFALILSYRSSRIRDVAGDEYYALALYAALGMALVAGGVNWIVFAIGLEL
ncbi:MAG: hypothetical protein LLG06_09680, partial [Desulfobacteraceae bacterium]|nr:hypothetical protein [Desulfobacteraceae bacterium]